VERKKLDIPDPRPSPRADLALKKAMMRAKENGREVNEIDVLIALYEDRECYAFQILWDLGISDRDIAALTRA
jgi:ATP-dependent Clp protease ATP-binding subunit ClpA